MTARFSASLTAMLISAFLTLLVSTPATAAMPQGVSIHELRWRMA
jgi:hypothetical protein